MTHQNHTMQARQPHRLGRASPLLLVLQSPVDARADEFEELYSFRIIRVVARNRGAREACTDEATNERLATGTPRPQQGLAAAGASARTNRGSRRRRSERTRRSPGAWNGDAWLKLDLGIESAGSARAWM